MASVLLWAGAAMARDFTPIQRDSFSVVGLQGRTSNALESAGKGIIGGIVSRAMQEQLLEHVSGRIGSETYALYFDYESDHNGAYTYLYGVRVRPGSKVPEGLTKHEVPAGEYVKFAASGDKPVAVVMGLWKQIWSLEDGQRLPRAYGTDVEEHAGSDVAIYVGVKPHR